MYQPLKSVFVRIKKGVKVKATNKTVLQSQHAISSFWSGDRGVGFAFKTTYSHSETPKTLDTSDPIYQYAAKLTIYDQCVCLFDGV